MEKVYCKYCGRECSSISSLVGYTCSKHPDGSGKGKCSPYEGSEKSKYTCKYCGREASSISSLVGYTCSKHPDGCGKGKCSPAK